MHGVRYIRIMNFLWDSEVFRIINGGSSPTSLANKLLQILQPAVCQFCSANSSTAQGQICQLLLPSLEFQHLFLPRPSHYVFRCGDLLQLSQSVYPVKCLGFTHWIPLRLHYVCMRCRSQVEPDAAARYRSEEDPDTRVRAENAEDVGAAVGGKSAIKADAANGMRTELWLNYVKCFGPRGEDNAAVGILVTFKAGTKVVTNLFVSSGVSSKRCKSLFTLVGKRSSFFGVTRLDRAEGSISRNALWFSSSPPCF